MNPFFKPRPETSMLYLRTNKHYIAGTNYNRNFKMRHEPQYFQPQRLPVREGFTPEIPEAIVDTMIGSKYSHEHEPNQRNNSLRNTMPDDDYNIANLFV